MGHQAGRMSLFDWKLEAVMDREKQKFKLFQVLLSNLSSCSIKNSGFRAGYPLSHHINAISVAFLQAE